MAQSPKLFEQGGAPGCIVAGRHLRQMDRRKVGASPADWTSGASSGAVRHLRHDTFESLMLRLWVGYGGVEGDSGIS